MADYIKEGAESIEAVANRVIKKHHEKLANIKIGYQFRGTARKSKGRTILAEASKIPGKLQNFINLDLIITVAEDKWAAAEDNRIREAIIDDVLRTIHLEEQETAENFPRRLADDYYQLSSGKKVKGLKKAQEAQLKLCDYEIKIYDYDVKANIRNMEEYGPWRKDLEKMEQSIKQTNIFSQVAGD
ncbi:putative metallopeptidase [Fuchsiella alkaliacetigena]|uniref:putative metallopeptidase n=1 Tax=Fuchsiella alkaliacetigena TaxID=957042 RepID=UPI00200BA097|nr:putative metallopeptidase [Fuchsiella alkaliacetigena]MCK8824714.1 hypothetical protein [Fuchsiella alkaliacetigena]